MYGSDSSFTPSTIMDAILYDDATLGINSNGQLYVKGGTSGGGLDITALQNYLTSNSYLNVTSGDNRYLKLSGGTINVSSGNPYIGYANSGANLGRIGVTTSFEPFFYSSYTGANNTIWHSGNDGSGSGMDADLLDGKHDGELTAIKLYSGGGSIIDANNFTYRDYALRFYSGIPDTSTNLPTTSGYQNGLLVFPIHSNGSTAQLYVSVGKNPYFRSQHTYEWNELAYKTDNVASATKLQTARTIWGQSFDGTGNVTGQLNITTGSNVKLTYGTGLLILGTMASAHIAIDTNDIQAKADGTTASTLYLNNYGGNVSMCGNGGKVGVGTVSPAYKLDVNGTVGFGSSATFYDVISINRNGSSGAILNTSNSALKVECYSTYTSFNTYTGGGTANANVFVLRDNGNVGIGTTSPSAKLHVSSSASYSCIIDSSYTAYGYNYGSVDLRLNNVSKGTIGVNTVPSSLGTSNTAGFYFHNRVSGEYMNFYNEGGTFLKSNLLVNGGITMYSDQRKKTILNHVELSLKQIAEAPLIEHYYNGDEKRTTHVGSIAQYWASMNDWFCKLDSEGFYTMEIQNAALASAISIARELDRYETKTDKAIKKLKMRICELEEEVERLKSA